MIFTAILLLNGSLTLLSIISVLALRHSALPTSALAASAESKGRDGVAYSGA
jgi:hypothetical protein